MQQGPWWDYQYDPFMEGGGYGGYNPNDPFGGGGGGGWPFPGYDPSIWMGGGWGIPQWQWPQGQPTEVPDSGTPTYKTEGTTTAPQNQVPQSGGSRAGQILAGIGGVLAGGVGIPRGGGQVPTEGPNAGSGEGTASNPLTSMFPSITGIINSGLNIWQMLESMKDANWNQASFIDQLNYQRLLQQIGLGNANNISAPQQASLLNALQQGESGAFGANGAAPYMQQMAQQMMAGATTDPWDPNRGMYQDPQMQAYQELLGSMAQGYNPGMAAGQNLLQNGAGVQGMLPGAQQRAAGQTNPQQAMLNPMYNLLDSRGQTNLSQQAKDAYTQALASGGYSGQLGQISNIANSLASSGGVNAQNSALFNTGMNGMGNALGTTGLTNTGGMIESQALQTLLGGGQNADSQYLSGRGQELSAENPVLPMELAASLSRNEYYTRAQQQYEAMRRQLAQRGGGEGFLAGNTQDKLAEASDDILRGGASAFANTLTGQQQLGLNQLGQGIGAVQAGGNLAAGREATAYGGGTGMEANATQRMGTAGNLATNAAGQQNQLLGLGLNTGLGADQQALARIIQSGGLAQNMSQDEISRMGLGSNLFGQYTGSLDSGTKAYSDLLGLDLNALTTGGNLTNQALQGQAGLYGAGYGAYTGNQNTNLARLAQGTSAQQGAFAGMNPVLNAYLNYYNTGASGLGNNLATWLGYGGNQAQPAGSTTNPPTATNLINPLKP